MQSGQGSRRTTRRGFNRSAAVAAGLAASFPLHRASAIPTAPTQALMLLQDSGDLPEVYLWQNQIALTRPEGSNPEKLEAVRQVISDGSGTAPIAYVPPPGDAGEERLNLTLGSRGEELDIFAGDWDEYKEAVQPINDLLDEHGTAVREAYSEQQWAGVTDVEGNIWGIPRLGLMGHTHAIFLRTDWLEELQIEMPATLEELEAAIEAFRELEPESSILASNLGDLRMSTVGGFTEFGYSRWLDPEDDRVKPPELQPGFRDWVARMNEWYEKGWFLPETFSSPGTDRDVKYFRTGRVGTFIGWYSRITIHAERVLSAVPGMWYDPAWGITGPEGLMKTNNADLNAAVMITKKSRDPAAAMRFINWQYEAKENAVTAFYGVQGVDWDWEDDYYVNLLTIDDPDIYAGEFFSAAGLVTETWFAPADPDRRRHREWIRDYTFAYDTGKMPVDAEVPYDRSLIRDKVPGLADLDRLIEEETTKFITGTRPLEEWDAFLEQLESAGLQDWIDAYTEQFLQYQEANQGS